MSYPCVATLLKVCSPATVVSSTFNCMFCQRFMHFDSSSGHRRSHTRAQTHRHAHLIASVRIALIGADSSSVVPCLQLSGHTSARSLLGQAAEEQGASGEGVSAGEGNPMPEWNEQSSEAEHECEKQKNSGAKHQCEKQKLRAQSNIHAHTRANLVCLVFGQCCFRAELLSGFAMPLVQFSGLDS